MVSAQGRPRPWAIGPKLHHFSFRPGSTRQIVFLERIGSAVHSHVFKAEIDGTVYALKMVCVPAFPYLTLCACALTSYAQFKFYTPIWPRDGRNDPPVMDTKDFVHQCDPFYSECRAYGRLKEAGREDLAVKVYGYLMINERDEDAVYTKMSRQFDFLVDWNRLPVHKNAPIRVIVKEYIQDPTPYTRAMFPAMMSNLKQVNSLGIMVWDIKEDNYMSGILIDFSQARTMPHFMLDLEDPIWSNYFKEETFFHDYGAFDNRIIKDWNERVPYSQKIWSRFLKSSKYHTRSRTRRVREAADKWARKDFSRTFSIVPHLPVAAFYDWERSGARSAIFARSFRPQKYMG